MNKFLHTAISNSGLTNADAARRWGKTPQAVNALVSTASPRAETLVAFLQAIGWELEDIQALTLGEVYNIGSQP